MSKIIYYVYYTEDKRGIHIHKFKDLVSARKSLRSCIINSELGRGKHVATIMPIDGFTCDIVMDQESGCVYKKGKDGKPIGYALDGAYLGEMYWDGSCVEYKTIKTNTVREVMPDGTLGTCFFKD